MIDHQTPIWRWLAAAGTGVTLNFVQGVDPWWPAIWLAPIPLLVAALATSSLRETLRLSLIASVLGLASTIWYCFHAGLPVLATAALTVVFAVPFGVPLVIDIRDDLRSFDGVIAYSPMTSSVRLAGLSTRVGGQVATGNYFQALGVAGYNPARRVLVGNPMKALGHE